MSRHETERLIKKYLLGNLSEKRRWSFEERLLTGNISLQKLEILEDELIDKYLRNSLSPANKKRFETYFLFSGYRQQKVRILKVLVSYIKP